MSYESPPHTPSLDKHKNFTINYKTKTYHLTPVIISHVVYIMSKIALFENMRACQQAGVKKRTVEKKDTRQLTLNMHKMNSLYTVKQEKKGSLF